MAVTRVGTTTTIATVTNNFYSDEAVDLVHLSDGGFAFAFVTGNFTPAGEVDTLRTLTLDQYGEAASGLTTLQGAFDGNLARVDLEASSGGNYFAAWEAGAEDSPVSDVFGALLNNASAPLTGVTGLSTVTPATDLEIEPVATRLGNGYFLATWSDSNGSAFNASANLDIRAQVFSDTGARVGAEFTLNSSTAGLQIPADGARLSGGQEIIVWQNGNLIVDGFGQPSGIDPTSIGGRFVDAGGTPLGSDFVLDTLAPGWDYVNGQVHVAEIGGGGFVLAWIEANFNDASVPVTDKTFAVRFQRFDAGGNPQGLVVNALVEPGIDLGTPVGFALRDVHMQVVSLPNGGFVMAGGISGFGFGHIDMFGAFDAGGNVIVPPTDFSTLPGFGNLGQIVSVEATADNQLLVVGAMNNAGTITYQSQLIDIGLSGFNIVNGTPGPDSDLNGTPGNDYISGLDGDDWIWASGGNDIARGGAGDDYIESGAGADTLDGGTNGVGGDWLSYWLSDAAVTVNLATNTASGGYATGDVISGFEHVEGSAHNDVLIGDLSANMLDGDSGDDRLLGGEHYAMSGNAASVLRLYWATLDRLPDAGGLQGWTAALDGGQSLQQITSGFINSAEFQAVYGALDNTQFVTLLYNNVLDRAPDAGGLAGWVAVLDGGGTRESVVNGFSQSAEFIGNTEFATYAYETETFFSGQIGEVFRLYNATLGRTPDAAGYQGWVEARDSGTALTDIISGFVGSAEFQQTYGALDNTQFVTLLYNNVLDRAPDAGGLAGWVAVLDGGASRESVVFGFSESLEHINAQAAPLETFLETTMTNWNDELWGGDGADMMYGGRGADTFVFGSFMPGADHVVGLDVYDHLLFENFGYASAADALAHMTQAGRDVVFSDQGSAITFHDTTLAFMSQHLDWSFDNFV